VKKILIMIYFVLWLNPNFPLLQTMKSLFGSIIKYPNNKMTFLFHSISLFSNSFHFILCYQSNHSLKSSERSHISRVSSYFKHKLIQEIRITTNTYFRQSNNLIKHQVSTYNPQIRYKQNTEFSRTQTGPNQTGLNGCYFIPQF